MADTYKERERERRDSEAVPSSVQSIDYLENKFTRIHSQEPAEVRPFLVTTFKLFIDGSVIKKRKKRLRTRLASAHRLSSYIIGVYFGTCFSRVRFLVVLKENVNYYVLPFPSHRSDLIVDTISLRCV